MPALLLFYARLTAPAVAVTGDNTQYTPIVYDTADVNVGSCYDPLTGTFTAPSTSIYRFDTCNLVVDSTGVDTYNYWELELQNITLGTGSSYFTYNGGQQSVSYTGLEAFTGGTSYTCMLNPNTTSTALAGTQYQNSIRVGTSGKTINILPNLTYWACYKIA